MSFNFIGARFERLVGFCRQIARIRQTPDLISFVAGKTEHIGFCRIISDPDDKFQKRFAAMCQANRMDPDDIRRRIRLVATVLGIYNQVDYYTILGVPPDADEQAIKQAYRKKAQILHPDKAAGDTINGKAFIMLQEAYLRLSDPKARRFYDQPYDGSVYWVEGDKSSKMAVRSVWFGRFLSWMFVLICSVIMVAYAFDIYKSGTITFFLEQSIGNRLDKPVLISKKQFNEGPRAKAMKIITNNIPHPNNDPALETESETVVALISETEVDNGNNNDVIVASLTKAKSAVFPQQNQTKSDRPVARANKNPLIKKAVYEKSKLRQKKKIKVVSHTNASTTQKSNAGVLSKNTIMTNANESAIKRKNINEIDHLHQQERLLAFLKKYTSTYERKDLHRFRTFFVQDALEQGKLFRTLLPTYQKTFSRVEALRYHIDLRSFTIDKRARKILIEGVYTASYRLPEKDWGNNSGTIRMELLDSSGGLMVSRLEYEMCVR